MHKAHKALQRVRIYTDGSVKRNPNGPGGYGAILQYTDTAGVTHEKELAEGYDSTTNNRMEIMAVIAAFEALKMQCHVDLYTDSQYITKSMTQGWIANWKQNGWLNSQGKPVKNRELWERLETAAAGHEVSWNWIKGHSGNRGNERCDRMAAEASERPKEQLLHDDGKAMRSR